jgi:hypothetical protein
MKVFLFSVMVLFVLVACKKDSAESTRVWASEEELYDFNAKKISIATGMAGTLIQREGNCMPVIEEGACRFFPVLRTIQFYDFTTQNDVEGNGPAYDAVKTQLRGEIVTDNDGFYQLALDTGTYSVFIYENGKYYANSYSRGGIYPIDVKTDSVSQNILVLDYAAY